MKKFLSIIAIAVLTQSCFGQPMMVTYSDGTKRTFDEFLESLHSLDMQVEQFSVDSFNFYFEQHLNRYRIAKNRSAVSYDKTVLKPAMDQAEYCSSKGYLDHTQYSDNKRWASDRCDYYGVERTIEFENLQSCDMRIPVMEEYVKGVNYYDALSRVVLWCWQLSPGHNASLLSEGEQFAVGISRDEGYTMYSCFVLISK